LVVLVAPAKASAAVQVTFKNWTVTTKNGNKYDVARGGSFARCGRKVVRITSHFDYTGATVGSSYKHIWSLNGNDILTSTRQWPKAAGSRSVSLFRTSGEPIPDGNYKLRLRQNGKGLGSSTITLKPGSSC
jgi:hypothetical protein